MKLKRALALAMSAALLLGSASCAMPALAEDESPKVETPKKEEPKKEEPKKEEPKKEEPKKEEPKPEEPKKETPKPETPKPETPKPEAPKQDEPKQETPKPEAPKTEPTAPEEGKPAEQVATPAPSESGGETPAPAGDETEAPDGTDAPEDAAAPGDGADADASVEPGETADPEGEETAEPTEIPEPTETPEPTPEPVKITSLTASRAVALCGKGLTFNFSARNAASLKYKLTKPDGSDSGTLSGSASSYGITTDKEGRYAFELTAIGEDGSEDRAHVSVECVDAPELKVSAKANALSTFCGDEVSFTLGRSEKSELASCKIEVYQGHRLIHSADSFSDSVTVKCLNIGRVTTVTLNVTLVDVYRQSATASVSIPCAVHASESRARWERTVKKVKLTGVWPEDLIAIAKTQVGYRESTVDFMVDDEGKRQGYTRYGDWYGLPYVDWCAMFVCFCLHYAGIPEESFVHCANNQRWIKALTKQGLYATRAEYNPKVGDLAIFDWENNNDADHVGIIAEVTTNAEGRVTSFKTIEGNSGLAVTYGDTYSTGDSRVVGYGLVNRAYDRKIERSHRELTAEGADYTVTAGIDPEAHIPARATLEAREIEPDGDAFEALVAEAVSWAAIHDGGELSYARFFEIGYRDETGKPVAPQAPVTYTITYRDKVRTDRALLPHVLSIDGEGGAAENTSGSFGAAKVNGRSASSYTFEVQPAAEDETDAEVIAGTIVSGALGYKAGRLRFNCPDYGVSIRYDADDGVPEGATLSIGEVTPGGIVFGRYRSAMREAIDLPEGDGALRVFEIGIDLNGMRVRPTGEVEIELTCARAGDAVRVVRLADGLEMDAELIRRGANAVIRFSTDSFSAFGLAFEAEDAA